MVALSIRGAFARSMLRSVITEPLALSL